MVCGPGWGVGAACMAAVQASGASKHTDLRIRFTIPPRDMPFCETLDHNPTEKSRGNVVEVLSTQFGDAGGSYVLGEDEAGESARNGSSNRKLPLPSKLRCFEPSDHFALIRDDLSLPEKDDAHDAHSDDARSDHEASLCFACRLIKMAPKPRHSRNLLVLGGQRVASATASGRKSLASTIGQFSGHRRLVEINSVSLRK